MKLSEILGYVSEVDFYDEYWEQRPLIVKAERKGIFRDILTMDDLNHILSNHRLRTDECKVSREGRIQSQSLYRCDYSMRVMERDVNDTVDTNKLLSLYEHGSTLVFSELNSRWFPIQQLKREIEKAFNATVMTNVFLTNKKAQGFSVHYDSHDVILLQLSGSKQWSIYSSPIQLPLKSQAFGRYLSSEKAMRAVEKLFVIELHEGDVLYLPRGFMHEAKTLDESSLHLTLGIHPKLATDYLVDAMNLAGLNSETLRKALPYDFYQRSPDEKRLMLMSWIRLAMDNLPDESLETICEEYRRRMTGLTEFCTPDHLSRINTAAKLEDASRLISEQESDIILDEFDGLLSILRGKTKLAVFPSCYKQSVEYILKHRDFSFQDIPGEIADEAKMSLLEKLEHNGIVSVI